MKQYKINGKQVNLLLAKFIEAGIRSTIDQLEFLEFKCGFEVKKLEDLETWQLDQVLLQLKDN